MASSSSPRRSELPAPRVRPLWSLAGPVRGLSLARETGWVLARDAGHWLYLLDRGGGRQAQHRPAEELTASACADDGSAYVAGGAEGDVWWLAPDLMPRWQRRLPSRVTALAVEPLGQYLAAADGGGLLHLFTRRGRPVWQARTPRPLHHLAFVPEAPFLVGGSDYGLVACLDARGKAAWQGGLVANVGSLAVSGDGSLIALACYADELSLYSLTDAAPRRLETPDVCRLAGVSYDGRTLLTAGLSTGLTVLDRDGNPRTKHDLESTATALAVGALGTEAAVGLANGQVLSLKWT